MDILSEDLLLHLSKFLDNNTCCTLSDLHKLSITNTFFYNMYKEKLTIHDIIPPNTVHLIYHPPPPKHSNCYHCGMFNRREILEIAEAINTAVCIHVDGPRRKRDRKYPNSLSQTIHFDNKADMLTLQSKVYSREPELKFSIYGRCCKGRGSTLYITHK